MKDVIQTTTPEQEVFNTESLVRADRKKYGLPLGSIAQYHCIEVENAIEGINVTVEISGGAAILHHLVCPGKEIKTENRVMLEGDTSKQVLIEKHYKNLLQSGEIAGMNFSQGFTISKKVNFKNKKINSISDIIAMNSKHWKSFLSAYIIQYGFWLSKSTGEWFITKEEAGSRNVEHYECALSTASKQRGGGAFACPSNWIEPSESLEKYLPEIKETASKLKGMEAMLNFLLNGWIAEQINSGEELDLIKTMARVGLLMSSGEAKDVRTDLKIKSVGDIKLPLSEVLPYIQAYAETHFPDLEKRKEFIQISVDNYKDIMHDGMIMVRKSKAIDMFGDDLVKQGHLAITRYLFHTRNALGRTGWSIAKGLTIVVEDALLDAHSKYAGYDIIFNNSTLKVNTVPDGIVERFVFQICSEVKGFSSNAIASQLSCQLIGDISKKSTKEAFDEANKVLCGIIQEHFELFNQGLKDPEKAIIFAGLIRKQRAIFEKQRSDFFIEKLLKVGGVNKTLIGELLYWKEGSTRFDKIRRECKFHCDSESLLLVQDPAYAFVDESKFIPTGKLAFNVEIEDIICEASDSSFEGIYDVFNRGMKGNPGNKILARYPLNAPGQIVLANALSKQDYKDAIYSRLAEAPNNLKKYVADLCLQIRGLVMSGLGIMDPQLGGCDWDGDRAMLSEEEKINNLIDSQNMPCIAKDSLKKAPKMIFSKENWTNIILTSLDVNGVGILANWGSAWADIYMLAAGQVRLPQSVIDLLIDIKKRAASSKDTVFAESLAVINNTTLTDVDTFYANAMIIAREAQIVIASLEMQAIDSAKDGKGVDFGLYDWVKPGLPKFKSKDDGRMIHDLVVPSWFKYCFAVKKKQIPESKVKIVYKSNTPFGNMMDLCETYIDDIDTKVRNVKGRCKLLFSHRDAEVMPFAEFMVALGSEFDIRAKDLIRKYASDEDSRGLTDEIETLLNKCKTILDNQPGFPKDDEALSCAIENYYDIKISNRQLGKFELDFAIELYGDAYLRELTRLNGGLVASATLVRSIKSRLTAGEFAISANIVYDASGLKVGRVSLPISDGLYTISRLNGKFYLTTTTEDEISDVVGHELRLFSNARSGDHSGQELHEAIVANKGIISVMLEGKNAVVHIGGIKCHVGDKGPNVAGFKLKVEVTDIKKSSLTAIIIGRGDETPPEPVNKELAGDIFSVAIAVQEDVCSYRDIEQYLDNKLGGLLKTRKLVIDSGSEYIQRYCENRNITLEKVTGPMAYAFFHDGSMNLMIEKAQTLVANPTRVMSRLFNTTPPPAFKSNFRVVISGGRDFNDYELLKAECLRILANKLETHQVIILSGHQEGADTLGENFAKEMKLPYRLFDVDWETLGNRAEATLNKQMVLHADAVICFWDGKSTETKSLIDTSNQTNTTLRTIPYSKKFTQA